MLAILNPAFSLSPPTSPDLDIPIPSSRFPISSIRPEAPQNCSANPPVYPPQLVYPRYDPLYILSRPSMPAPQLPNSYAHVSPKPAPSVAPGVLADGVLTAMLPDVKGFLAEAAIAPPACPQLPTDKRILALAALSVFYRPLHPAHWVFWNREQKRATATIVQSVLDSVPSSIISPIAWIAIPENLWILASMQHAYSSRLATLPWYAAYMSTAPEHRMNLRKRKPPAITTPDVPGGGGTPSGEETADEDEAIALPPRKRARTRRAATTREQTSRAVADHTSGDIQHTAPDAEPQPQAKSLLLLSHVDPSISTLSPAAPKNIDDAVRRSSLLDASGDIPHVRKSLCNSPANGSVSSSVSRPRTRATASPISVASTLTPQIGVRGLSMPLSRQSPSSSAGSVAGSTSGLSTVVGLDDDVSKYANKVTFGESVAVAAVVTEDLLEAEEVIKPSRTKTTQGSRGSNAFPRAVKEKKETAAFADVRKKNGTTQQARSKARTKTRKR